MNKLWALIVGFLLASALAWAVTTEEIWRNVYNPAGGGSVDVTGTITSTPSGTQAVHGTAADGAAASGNPVQIGGVDGSGNAQSLLMGTSGQLAAAIQAANTVVAENISTTVALPVTSTGTAMWQRTIPFVYDAVGGNFDFWRGAAAAATAQAEGAGKTADFTLVAALTSTKLTRWSCEESAGTPAAARVVLRHDTVATTCDGPVFAYVPLSASGGAGDYYGDRGEAAALGVCMDVTAGTVSCSVSTVVE